MTKTTGTAITTMTTQRSHQHDLYRGHPNIHSLPYSEMKSIMMSALLQIGGNGTTTATTDLSSWMESLNYGAYEGDIRMRLALRTFLDRRTWGDERIESINNYCFNKQKMKNANTVTHSTEKDGGGGYCNSQKQEENELFLTQGVSHGIELLCATCTQPGEEVWVERPTYFLAPQIFKSHGLAVKALPMKMMLFSDRIGSTSNEDIGCRVDIDSLIRKVEEEGVAPPRLIYIIPSHHNPTGRTLTLNERERLASFAIRNGIILVADEVYHLLDWDVSKRLDNNHNKNLDNTTQHATKRPCGMVHFNLLVQNKSIEMTLDRIGCCISVSSFTKIWAPGIRLGWIDAPSFIIQRLKQYGYIQSQGGCAPFMGRIMAHAIELNLLDTHLNKLQQEYAERCQIMCNILKEEPRISILSQNSRVKRQGGYFIWVRFPSEIRSEDFLNYAMANHGVKFMTGAECDPCPEEDDTCGKSIRSCAR